MKITGISKIGSLLAAVMLSGGVQAEDAYVQSDKTQYVDLGCKVTSQTRVEVDMQLLAAEASTERHLFGFTMNKADALSFGCYLQSETAAAGAPRYSYNCRTGSSQWRKTACAPTTARRTIVLDAHGKKFSVVEGGSEVYSENLVNADPLTGEAAGTLVVFAARNYNFGDVRGFSDYKLFGVKVYEAGELTHEFIPYLWDGEVLLKDLKTGAFCHATGTNPLSYGGEIATDGYVMTTGAQFIDTGYVATDKTCVELDFQLTGELTGESHIFGFNGTADATAGLVYGLYATAPGANVSDRFAWNCRVGKGNWTVCGTAARPSQRKRYVFVLDAFNRTWQMKDLSGVKTSGTIDDAYFTATAKSDYSIALGGDRTKTLTVNHRTAMKVFGMKIYEKGALVRNFVPCRKDGVYGLKDVLSGSFVSDWATDPADRLSGGGDMIVEDDDPYVYNGDGQTIDLGYKMGPKTRLELTYSLCGGLTSGYVFGSTYVTDGGCSVALYPNSNGYYGFCCQDNASDWSTLSGTGPSLAQQTIVFDRKAAQLELFNYGTHAGSAATPIKTTQTLESYHDIVLCGTRSQKSAGTVAGKHPLRIYSCKIYEDDKLVYDFKPYVKAGVAGLFDAASNRFVAAMQPVQLETGGAVENDGDAANLTSFGEQAVNTGYLAGPTSRIEVDFAVTRHTGVGERFFGCTGGGDFRLGLYAGGSTAGAGNFAFVADADGTKPFASSVPVDLMRHTAVIDLAGGKAQIKTAGETVYERAISVPTTSCTWPLGLFGEPADASFSTGANLASMRIYSVKIFESDVLVHHFLPASEGDEIGFKDVVAGGVVKGDCLAAANPLVLGGKGWDAEGHAFYLNPADAHVTKAAPAITLRAFAPAAVAYQWLKDGEEIAGATTPAYLATWTKGDADETEYSVRCTFNRYGVEETATSAVAKLIRDPLGLILLFR